MNDLVRRWDTNQKALVLASLKGGLSPLSPFGKTEEGLVDLRGLQLEEPLLLNELSADGLDLSFSRIPKMLCVRSNFVNCSLRKAKVLLLSNGSIFENVDFSHADISKSASGSATKFIDSSFKFSNLTGGGFKQGFFENCDFSNATLNMVEFGECDISDSVFDGVLNKCFFRGSVNRCDFRSVAFIDCAFYGVELNDCLLSKDAILFKNWVEDCVRICRGAKGATMSDEARKSLDKWCGVWQKLEGVMRDEVIDYQSLRQQEGVEVADEIFAFFKSVAVDSARPLA